MTPSHDPDKATDSAPEADVGELVARATNYRGLWAHFSAGGYCENNLPDRMLDLLTTLASDKARLEGELENVMAEGLAASAELAEERAKEHRVCSGCGSSHSDADIEEHGWASCCPERSMLTAKEWANRAERAEAERDQWKTATDALCAANGIQDMAERYYALEADLSSLKQRVAKACADLDAWPHGLGGTYGNTLKGASNLITYVASELHASLTEAT